MCVLGHTCVRAFVRVSVECLCLCLCACECLSVRRILSPRYGLVAADVMGCNKKLHMEIVRGLGAPPISCTHSTMRLEATVWCCIGIVMIF